MPDSYGFTHEPHRGEIFHRCVECDEFPWGTRLSEAQRRRHHEKHERARAKQLDHERRQNLAKARKALTTKERENRSAYGEEG